MDRIALLHFVWGAIRNTRALFSKVVASPKFHTYQLLLLILIGAAALVVIAGRPSHAQDWKDLTDVTIRTGAQLKDAFSQLVEKNQDINVAAKYFTERKLSVHFDGLSTITARSVKTKDQVSFFFVPFTEPTPISGLTHVVVFAQGPKRSVVALGTVSAVANEQPTVKEEKVVTAGKVEPGKDFLKNWLKCAATACVSATSCFLSGPAAVACFCLACGGAVAACGILEGL